MTHGALRSVTHPGHGCARCGRSARWQAGCQGFGEWMTKKYPARFLFVAIGLQNQVQAKLPVERVGMFEVAYEQKARFVRLNFGRERFERDLGADARDVTKRDADEKVHVGE